MQLIIPLMVFIVMVIFLWKGLSLKSNLIPSPLINKSAPSFSLPLLADLKVKTSEKDFLGHITLVNVWATWCIACQEEHEFLLKLANHHDLVLYGLNYKDNAEKAKKWLEIYGNPYKMVAVDESGDIAIDWGVYGTPESFILDKKGIIRYKHIGPLSMEIWERELQPIVKKLESETS
jgi:cytochrome c biogenesis protein CcmG/thiol:disulfide interchange protein DsbE